MTDEEIIKSIDFENEDSIIEALYIIKEGSLYIIKEGSLYTGTNEDGDEITISVKPKNGIRVSTYQKNGWIRINDYDLLQDENRQDYILRTESYER